MTVSSLQAGLHCTLVPGQISRHTWSCANDSLASRRAHSTRKPVLNDRRRGYGRRGSIAPVAASPIQQLQQIFSLGSPVKSASKEMQTMIQEGSNNAERFGELVDILLDSELPFKEASLGGGEWQAGQDFDPSSRSVINRGEVLGSQVVVSAQGTYEPQDSKSNLPKLVKANISGGQVTAWGQTIPLPISGSGFFSIMYIDDTIRVFSDQKKGTVSVQVQADRLNQLISMQQSL